MRNLFYLLMLALSLGLSGCVKDDCSATRSYVRYDPVYIAAEDFRKPVVALESKLLQETGKIYVYQDLLLINEPREGIHIFDNSDPEAPQPLSFLPIPGNQNLAVRNGLLYADSWVDLVAIDISDPRQAREVSRTEEVFPHYGFRADTGFIVEYEPSEVTETVVCDDDRGDYWFADDHLFFAEGASEANFSTPDNGGNTVGIGGSLARFMIRGDYLYSIDESTLRTFELRNGAAHALHDLQVGWGMETIFAARNHLFLGGRAGMEIVSIEQPASPQRTSTYWHQIACDPVFVDGDWAYITLRDGTDCENTFNQLEVVDISDLNTPTLKATFPMEHPIGLAVKDDVLFLCDDHAGLRIFDASMPTEVGNKPIGHLQNIQAVDIIAMPSADRVLVIGPDGLYQYDSSDPANLELLSIITRHEP